ncbi:MAG TPA: MotA/TolQ/ExbB proton channel family protein [Thermoanaerobaculales bacterium]|nr:MotA/TolQ/ExbB proton channel family protein [Thermoanaerobaculales bacterium]HPA79867.1 MotA/TolQ/ExbB proton channel family protein [Thermoanaerobaculales bacterium]HQL28765.1 MotA/TolQ/ExbB proton channel family protein [Thermoanaerobaculales bacterium]HQN96125.1 MotA/TolQ/ExbB proton channel family protein [Thermoanaerobaculales bacterium]HQP42679.1 MotA/TolQ/ExbB proton channel family protein [Thermoanaerobaculales bacterium]
MFGQVYTYFIQGGPFMWPILLFSLIALAVIIERFIVFHKAKINVNEFLTKVRKALLVNRNVKEAIKVCEQYRGPVASVVKAGLLRYGHDREDIEKTIENAALYELDRLERRLGILATTANVEPMLGFLGTVSGMIKSFGTLATQGLSNPGAVAAGISEALITTAAGLIIAIPAQLAFNWFTTKVTRFVRDIETASNMLMETFIEMEGKSGGTGATA